jgi:hypothetical protein
MNTKNRWLVKRTVAFVLALMSFASAIPAQEESASPAGEANKYPEVPKGYEVGEDTISPDGRFAILYPVRPSDGLDSLVRLKPYAELIEDVCPESNGPGWIDSRGAPAAKWGGNEFVAIWQRMKWGPENLVVYEIANDKVKRVEKIWPEVVKYFDRHVQRLLKKYPKESVASYTFVGDEKSFEFKDHKLLLNIFADNKPNLAPGPHWTAQLHAIWNLDTAKFDMVDFRPGKIDINPEP